MFFLLVWKVKLFAILALQHIDLYKVRVSGNAYFAILNEKFEIIYENKFHHNVPIYL